MKSLHLRKAIFKKFIITIITFFLLQLIISAYFIPIITSFSLKKSNIIWYDLYHVILFFIFGLSFGFIGNKKGWILCFLFDFSIIIFYTFIYTFTDILEMNVYNVGFCNYIFKIIYFHIFYLLYLLSGYFSFIIPYYLYMNKK